MLWPWSHPSIRLVQDAPIHKTILIKLKKIYLHIIFTLAAACIDWGHLPMSYTKSKSLLILPSWSTQHEDLPVNCVDFREGMW